MAQPSLMLLRIPSACANPLCIRNNVHASRYIAASLVFKTKVRRSAQSMQIGQAHLKCTLKLVHDVPYIHGKSTHVNHGLSNSLLQTYSITQPIYGKAVTNALCRVRDEERRKSSADILADENASAYSQDQLLAHAR